MAVVLHRAPLHLCPAPRHWLPTMRLRHISQTLALLTVAVSQGCNSQQTQFAFGIGNEGQLASSSFTPPTYQRAKKVAILGAGPGGTSTAYFLSRAQEKLQSMGRGGEGFEVTLFEREERIGGRTAIVHPYFDEKLPAIELGASIFADVNRNLKRAAEDFNLETKAKLGEGGTIGVWDGQQFLVEGLDNGWWNSARMFWRYGYSPITTQNVVKKIVDRFVQLYDPGWLHQANGRNQTASGFPWTSIESLAKSMSLDDLAAQDAGDYFYSQGVAKLFSEEMIEAATLVNYGQEVYSIHGVGGGVSLAASGAVGVTGGNYRLFEEFLGRCDNLKLRLGVHGEVTGLARFRTFDDLIERANATREELLAMGLMGNTSATQQEEEARKSTKWWLGTKSGYGDLFDAVFVALPWHSSGISLLNTHSVIPSYDYVRLHVTILVTTAKQPDPAYFGRGKGDAVPTTILTSHISLRKAQEKKREDEKRKKSPHSKRGWWPGGGGGGGGGSKGRNGPVLDFNSLSYLQTIDAAEEGGDEEHVVKIFSAEELSDDKLEEIFGKDQIKWLHRKEWDAYPYLRPTRTFAPVQVDENFYYPSAMEALISTMETSTVSARNAVALYLEKLFGFDFVHGGSDCPWQAIDGASKPDWAGWGCQSG